MEVDRHAMPRILIADNDADGCEIVTRVLIGFDYQVDTAGDGRRAYDAALGAWVAGRPYDLILVEVDIPVLDGFAMTEMLREQGYDRRIAALTRLVGSTNQCLRAGCDDFAPKPVSFDSLLGLVERNLESVDDALAFPMPVAPTTRPTSLRFAAQDHRHHARRRRSA